MTVSFSARDIRLFHSFGFFQVSERPPIFAIFHRLLTRVFVPLFDGIPANEALVTWAFSIEKPDFGISPSTIYLKLFFDLSQVLFLLLFITG